MDNTTNDGLKVTVVPEPITAPVPFVIVIGVLAETRCPVVSIGILPSEVSRDCNAAFIVKLSAIILPEKVPRLVAAAATPERVISELRAVLSAADMTPAKVVVAAGTFISVPVEEKISTLAEFNVWLRSVFAEEEPPDISSIASARLTLSLYS